MMAELGLVPEASAPQPAAAGGGDTVASPHVIAAMARGNREAYGGGQGGTLHSYSPEEELSYAAHINEVLKDDVDCGHQLPIDTSEGCPGMYEAIGEGLIICKLINAVVNDEKLHIDRRALNKKKKLHPLQKAVRACPCAPPAARCPDVRWAGRRTTIWRSTPA